MVTKFNSNNISSNYLLSHQHKFDKIRTSFQRQGNLLQDYLRIVETNYLNLQQKDLKINPKI